MKQALRSQFIYFVAPHLSSGFLLPTDYGTTIKSLHNRAVSGSGSLLSDNRILQAASPEKADLLRSYRNPFHNFIHIFLAPSTPIVRGYD